MRDFKKGDRVSYSSPYYGDGVGTVDHVLEDRVAYGAPYSVVMDHVKDGQPNRDYFEAVDLDFAEKFSVTLVFGGPGLHRVEVVESNSLKGLRRELYKKSFEQLLDEDDRSMQQWRIDNRIKRKG